MKKLHLVECSCLCLLLNNWLLFISVQKLNTAIEEYDLGRKYLANIMGLDDENMSQEDVRVCKNW